MDQNLFNEINQYKFVFLDEISEPFDVQGVRLIVRAATVSAQESSIPVAGSVIEGVRSIEPSDICYEIFFDNYVAYFVLNDSFDIDYPERKTEEWEGSNFRVSSKTVLTDYMEVTMQVTKDWVGNYKHYKLYGQTHVINVVSLSEPKLRKFISPHTS